LYLISKLMPGKRDTQKMPRKCYDVVHDNMIIHFFK
jgi:hypothetical protein